MPDSKSGRAFLQRYGLIQQDAGPNPRFSPGSLLVNPIPLEAPLPQPELRVDTRDGNRPEGDGTITQPWPHI